jgi:hypothetical protein
MLKRSYQVLICNLFGHEDVDVKLDLGKISTEEVQAIRCARCGRISILKSELTWRKE